MVAVEVPKKEKISGGGRNRGRSESRFCYPSKKSELGEHKH